VAVTRLQHDATESPREQVVARPVATIEIGSGCFDRQIHETELLVDADLAPDADVAVGRPRSVLPRVVAELAGSRNSVELPELLPRAHVEGANKPFRVVVRLDRSPFSEGGANNRDVAGNRRSRVHANFTGLEIDLLLVAVDDTNLQIDEPVFAEPGNRRTGLRVEFGEAVAGRG